MSLQYRTAASGGFVFNGANSTLLGLVEDVPSLLLLCFAPNFSLCVEALLTLVLSSSSGLTE